MLGGRVPFGQVLEDGGAACGVEGGGWGAAPGGTGGATNLSNNLNPLSSTAGTRLVGVIAASSWLVCASPEARTSYCHACSKVCLRLTFPEADSDRLVRDPVGLQEQLNGPADRRKDVHVQLQRCHRFGSEKPYAQRCSSWTSDTARSASRLMQGLCGRSSYRARPQAIDTNTTVHGLGTATPVTMK